MKKLNIKIGKISIAIGILFFLLYIIIGFIISNNENVSGEFTETFSKNSKNKVTGNLNMSILAENSQFKGNVSAPITIIEWSDFECTFCKNFYSETSWLIDETYVKQGKVKFVYKHFPITFLHENAKKAAEAAECAGEQEKFWEMHDFLFEKGVDGGMKTFMNYAKALNLDNAKFDQCLKSGVMAKKIEKDMQEGASLGIEGTPTFIANGILFSGSQPFELFKQIIEEELVK